MKYRPEIDGLRAVAVLLIVLFHVDGHICSGGYIGVGVFLVISGFLIASIIRKQVSGGAFTLVGFYEWRRRLIQPEFFRRPVRTWRVLSGSLLSHLVAGCLPRRHTYLACMQSGTRCHTLAVSGL